ncbi:hypothetical protein Mal15_44610 [Stieleria maiorica]|uniref:Uncharacterized protein n=1 Tax=Stieleria maiorica TaxID=2795974 RepID=A0A5B9MK75_9BACT|nr:hypothetical protein [Stieleria maiorica]QEG00391.1 hypothetical protein Mal15_44610 [Stieleria maiorica]
MFDQLSEMVRLAQQSWVGCCWETEFGSRRLNLRGLQARQAVVAAKATRGDESQCWYQAAQWLAGVEHDAKTAAEHAQQALNAVASGDLAVAIKLFDQASVLAAKYPVSVGYVACRSLCEDLSCSDPATA